MHHLGYSKRVGPKPDQPGYQRPVTAAQSRTTRSPSQRNIELMTEEQVLGFKPGLALPLAAFKLDLPNLNTTGSARPLNGAIDRIILFF